MASPPPPPLQPRAAPPPPPPPPPPFHDTTLTLALALPPPQPLALALPSSPKPPHARRPRRTAADGAAFARVRSSPTGDAPPCTECGKLFPSWKALFGHMRCHPERQWRGITPPPPHFRHGAADQFTVQEREVAASLLMLAGARSGAGKAGKKSLLGSPTWKQSGGGTSASSPTMAPATSSKCDNHKCSVCHRGFATGQALGGHKRCHWEGACAEAVVAATSGNCSVVATSEEAIAATATTLDLNLAPPGPPLPWTTNDQGSSMNALLDLKLGY